MAASVGSQHRCVFVGNIPYDATEEQLIQICEEVGPVVSFRLVSDRETGKPKGYGFCEYKDEETALSARRNLQGYEINGRQLRVDFAENDKNADRNREQGRGGPGLASNSNADVQKQLNAAHTVGDSTLHQPMGFPLAATAASVMARALGGAQSANAQNLLQSQHGMGNDPLTPYLSRISRQQLHQIMLEMKALTTQNKTLARQLLQSNPQLAKALFQAQIMLDMVTPQMMQIASSSRPSISVPQLSSHLGQTSSQSLSGNLSRPPEHQLPSTSKNPGILQQATIPHQQVTIQPQYQLPPLHQSQVLQGTVADEPGHAMVSSRWSQSVGNLPAQPSLSTSKSLMAHSQSLPQLSVSTSAASLAHHPQLALPNMTSQQASLPQPLISQPGLSSGQLKVSTSLQGSNWPSGRNTQSIGSGLADQTLKRTHPSEMINYTSKSQRLEGGIQATQLVSSNSSGNSQTLGTGSVAGSKVLADPDQHSQKLQLPSEVESALLQQVLSLTPEQLSLLTPEQRQQVLQLQQMLSASK